MPGQHMLGYRSALIAKLSVNALKNAVVAYCDELGGFIIRTVAEGIDEEELAQDIDFLKGF